MLLLPEVLSILLLDIVFLVFLIIAFFLSIKIFLKWDINSTSNTQYNLEKQSFLTATIIKYIFALKLPLFLFFIFTLDKISNVLTGAMCAAGVVDATQYGLYLFIFKILNLYIFGFWLLLHKIDISDETLPYTKIKFGFFCIVFFLFITEIILEFYMFSSINPNKMVSCCGTLYSNSSTSYISNLFKIDTMLLLSSFYGLFIIMILGYIFKLKTIFAFSNLFFLIVAIISLIIFFGTYIYELPTHHCPFCLLQKDYYYIGYFLYSFLFFGTFYGIVIAFLPKIDTLYYTKSLLFNFLYIVIVSSYVLVYYWKNGVFL